MADAAFDAPARKPRFLMINDVADVCTFVEALYSYAFDVDFESVESSVEALVRLLSEAYDLMLMDCIHPVGSYDLLPPEVAAWSINAVFLIVGLILFARAHK